MGTAATAALHANGWRSAHKIKGEDDLGAAGELLIANQAISPKAVEQLLRGIQLFSYAFGRPPLTSDIRAMAT